MCHRPSRLRCLLSFGALGALGLLGACHQQPADETFQAAVVTAEDEPDEPAASASHRRDHAQGIDVSHHQEAIDWPEVALSGIHFVYIKATEGVDWRDPDFLANWQGAGEARLMRGAYHMLRPEDDAIEQAKWYLAALEEAGYSKTDMLPALDVERASTTTQVPRRQTAERALQWLHYVEQQTGRKPVVYTNPKFWQDYLEEDHPLTEYHLWLADYSEEPEAELGWGWADWHFWQFSQRGDLPGIDKTVDLNRFNGTPEELHRALLGDEEPEEAASDQASAAQTGAAH